MKVEDVLDRLAAMLATEMLGSSGSCLAFKIGDDAPWYLDASGAKVVVDRVPRRFDCLYELSHCAFQNLAAGKVSPQRLFFDGALHIKGDLRLVRQLSLLAKVAK